MTDAQIAQAQANYGPILAIPMTMGAVAIVYTLPNNNNYQLKLTGSVLADIYFKKNNLLGWPAITDLNPGADLTHTAIAVVHRSDSSGTSYIFYQLSISG